MSVFVGFGLTGKKALRIADGRSQNRMTGNQSRVQHDDPRSILRWRRHFAQVLDVGEDERPFQADTGQGKIAKKALTSTSSVI